MTDALAVDPATLATILGMAGVTYATRVAGLALAGRVALRGRAKAAFDAIPPAVLTAVIAPAVLLAGWPEAIAGALVALAAIRLPLVACVAVGVGAVVALRALAGA
ncbi:AzlD family protein [Salinarimonas sp. NSM]|uniref:AzlD family protein n=1 Tax=Salinarimonas sp. NSM TaxID=3458003 RepID=UPI004036DEBD